MSEKKINLAIIWNMHQPYYKDLVTGEYILPWVRLHGIKDYFDMVHILEDFPRVRQTFNLVPSLMKQIEDYADTDLLEIKDIFLQLSLKPACSLSVDDRCFLLRNFFLAHRENMINIYPRYRELLEKRGMTLKDRDVLSIQKNFSVQDMLDLQVWYNLAWFDPSFKNGLPQLKALIKRGRGFKESDKTTVLRTQQDIIKRILPEYKKFQEKGQIEVCLSPMYHPILPLLCDSNEARMAIPDINLPGEHFLYPQDAAEQVRLGIEYYKKVFGRPPKGMWPSEGSLSEKIIPILTEAGIEWIASDEEILAKSLDTVLERDHADNLINPRTLYQPYGFQESNLSIVFRDHFISDLIGFVYSNWEDPVKAAQDFVNRLHSIRNNLGETAPKSLVTIILDGENAWEYYVNDGHDFLEALYELLNSDSLINCTTVSDFLEKQPPKKKLPKLFSGSWINHNFRIWIGHPEDNRAWDQIYRARAALKKFEEKGHNIDMEIAKKIAMAWEELYIAEGSDWFWWYGDDHSSVNDPDFDHLFRKHLINIYTLIGMEAPSELYQSNILGNKDISVPCKLPKGFISPTINGKITDYFEWLESGTYAENKGAGAMHNVSGIIKSLKYGFNLDKLFLRLDFKQIPHERDLGSFTVKINFFSPHEIKFLLKINNDKIRSIRYCQDNDHWKDGEALLEAAIFNVLETGIGFDKLKAGQGDQIDFLIIIEKNQAELERWPNSGSICLNVPDKNYAALRWQV